MPFELRVRDRTFVGPIEARRLKRLRRMQLPPGGAVYTRNGSSGFGEITSDEPLWKNRAKRIVGRFWRFR
jgi:hypothetical protein